jgi:hypothetical protein
VPGDGPIPDELTLASICRSVDLTAQQLRELL